MSNPLESKGLDIKNNLERMDNAPHGNAREDSDLIRSILAGGRAEDIALEYINTNRNFRNSIRAFILRNGGQEDDVMSVFNEALLALHRRVKSLDEGDADGFSLFGFLFVTCRYLWFRHLRNQKRRKERSAFTTDLYERRATGENRLLSPSDVSKLEKVEQAIDGLGEPCRSILLMREMGVAYAEIVDKLQLSSEVNARVSRLRCIDKLLKKLDDLFPGEF